MLNEIIGARNLAPFDHLPCRVTPVLTAGGSNFFSRILDNSEVEFLSLLDFSIDGDCIYLQKSFREKANHCLIQVGENILLPDSFEYIPEEKFAERLAELGIEAVKRAKSFLDEGKEDEAEKLLWYAARAMPKSASALMLLRIVLRGKISIKEMEFLDRKIQELMVI